MDVDIAAYTIHEDSQPNSWLAWFGVALFYINQMNRVNSRNDLPYDSSINIVRSYYTAAAIQYKHIMHNTFYMHRLRNGL